ncbi:unnamed protein product [Amoebophrya sp. A25]|nr:unnamed protein product [Amoebophrya sp. A25]|eukprot:GSA25T00016387001.1
MTSLMTGRWNWGCMTRSEAYSRSCERRRSFSQLVCPYVDDVHHHFVISGVLLPKSGKPRVCHSDRPLHSTPSALPWVEAQAEKRSIPIKKCNENCSYVIVIVMLMFVPPGSLSGYLQNEILNTSSPTP